MIDIEALRRDTLGVNHVIHFNNAGAALMPQPVYLAMMQYQSQELSQGGYEVAQDRADDLQSFYPVAAGLIQAHPEEIAYTDSATTAWRLAFYSLPWQPGDVILTSETDYASCFLAYLQVKRRYGVEIQVVASDKFGQISIPALEAAIHDRVKLISIGHMPSNGGLVNPVQAVGQVANRYGITYLLDACQSVGQYPVDVNQIGCDFLCATGRKYLRGPRGTGFLYARQATTSHLEPVMLDLHSAQWNGPERYTWLDSARRFEAWEANLANKLGLMMAIRYATNLGLEPIWQRVSSLAQSLRQQLQAIPRVTVRDLGQIQSGIVTFTVERTSLRNLKQQLRSQSINVSITDTATTRLDMEKRGLTELVRASLHYYNTEAEIEQFCQVLQSLVQA